MSRQRHLAHRLRRLVRCCRPDRTAVSVWIYRLIGRTLLVLFPTRSRKPQKLTFVSIGRVSSVSQSQDEIDARIDQLQQAVDSFNVGSEFELKDLFEPRDWLAATDNLRLAKSITVCFKKRIIGWPSSIDPVIQNVQVGNVRQNGRERMFRRIIGNHQELAQ